MKTAEQARKESTNVADLNKQKAIKSQRAEIEGYVNMYIGEGLFSFPSHALKDKEIYPENKEYFENLGYTFIDRKSSCPPYFFYCISWR